MPACFMGICERKKWDFSKHAVYMGQKKEMVVVSVPYVGEKCAFQTQRPLISRKEWARSGHSKSQAVYKLENRDSSRGTCQPIGRQIAIGDHVIVAKEHPRSRLSYVVRTKNPHVKLAKRPIPQSLDLGVVTIACLAATLAHFLNVWLCFNLCFNFVLISLSDLVAQ